MGERELDLFALLLEQAQQVWRGVLIQREGEPERARAHHDALFLHHQRRRLALEHPAREREVFGLNHELALSKRGDVRDRMREVLVLVDEVVSVGEEMFGGELAAAHVRPGAIFGGEGERVLQNAGELLAVQRELERAFFVFAGELREPVVDGQAVGVSRGFVLERERVFSWRHVEHEGVFLSASREQGEQALGRDRQGRHLAVCARGDEAGDEQARGAQADLAVTLEHGQRELVVAGAKVEHLSSSIARGEVEDVGAKGVELELDHGVFPLMSMRSVQTEV